MFVGQALAAPDRLNDDVPDAQPDMDGALNATYGFQSLQLEGPLNSEQTAHQLFKLRYSFNPHVYGAFRYEQNDLAGGLGLLTPIYNNADSASSMSFDLGLNLLNVAPVPEDKAKNQVWAAGSAFGIGLSGTQYALDKGAISETDTLIKAYLVYSTDLTEEMRAHTYFSSGRLTGDSASGSVNRIAAGLDYNLSPGCRPLVLMANGILDVYNFRQPTFNTSRITRFDFGLRYRFADDWYANLGWATLNDSENDASGSGIFASLNFVDGPPCCEPCIEPPPPPPADPAAAPAEAPKTSQALPLEDGLLLAADDQPPSLMAQSPAGQASAADTKSAASTAAAGSALPGNELVSDSGEAAIESDGILIPGFPEEAPAPTAQNQLMARAPVGEGWPELSVPELEPSTPVAGQSGTASVVLPHLDDLAVVPGGKQQLLAAGSTKPLERRINVEKETAGAESGETDSELADSESESGS